MNTVETTNTITNSTATTASNRKIESTNKLSYNVPTPLLSHSNWDEEPQLHSQPQPHPQLQLQPQPQPQPQKSLSSSSSLDLPSTFVNSSSLNSNVLHEAVIKKFNRTSSGKIYEKDLRDIYSMLIVSLSLSTKSSPSPASSSSASSSSSFSKRKKPSTPSLKMPLSKIKLIPSSKKYPYSFRLSDAIDQMDHLLVEIELSNTVTCLSYSFQSDIALTLISQFYKAKLLHCPADRTRAEPKHDAPLQPTPKGLAIVQSFCEKVGIKKLSMPEILLQKSYNSMQLFHFDRDPVTDKVIYSKSLLHLLFAKLLGPCPNVWSPMNKPDPIHCVTEKEEFNFGNHADEFPLFLQKNSSNNCDQLTSMPIASKHADPFSFSEYQKKNSKSNQPSSEAVLTSIVSEPSSYHHRYFSNPESDAHMQYYVSSVGVRLSKEKYLDDSKSVLGPFCYRIYGKAIVQWLMDCTDLVRPKHALEIANLFLNQKLIKACNPAEGNLQFQKDSYYCLDDRGVTFCMWNKVGTTRSGYKHSGKQNPFRPEVTLDTIMLDPGLKFQFKTHLENEFCLENFEAYCQLLAFQENVKLWNDLMGGSDLKHDVELSKQTLQHQISLRDTCMSIAYQIYNTYISHESPSMLNIDYGLRQQVVNLLTRVSNEDESYSNNDLKTYMQTPTDDSSIEEIGLVQEHLNNTDEINLNQVLNELTDVFNKISVHLYKMMQVDSLPKFLNSLDKI